MTKKPKEQKNPSTSLGASKKTADHDDKVKELEFLLQRIQADFVNYRQRAEREKSELIEYGRSDMVKELLTVFDNFERARSHFPKELEKNEWAQGMLAVEKQFGKKMEDMGIKKIPTVGEMFDPHLHEAIHMESVKGKQSNTIIEEYESGYIYKDKILRYAKVKLAQ